MKVEDFRELVTDSGILSETLADRDINMAFNLSVSTYLDELNKYRHCELNFVEFLEAVSRLADALSPYPLGVNPEEYNWNYD